MHLGVAPLGIAGSHPDSGPGWACSSAFIPTRAGSQASYTAVERYFADCLALCRQGQGEALAAVIAVVTGWIAMRWLLYVVEVSSGQWCVLAINETFLPGKCWKAVSGL